MDRTQLKDHFNTVATGAEYSSYEERRWSANPKVQAQQEATAAFVQKIAVPLARGASRVTELGAGPGTWTKFIHETVPTASFLLLDISSEMLARARAALPGTASVSTMEGDFVSLTLPPRATDLFFSSRAIEYISPKDTLVHMIMDHVAPGGRVCVTTKMPKPRMNSLSGRTQGSIHRDQITPNALANLFRSAGGTDVRLYPVTFSFPILRSAALDRVLTRLFALRPLWWLPALFCESYGLTARKP